MPTDQTRPTGPPPRIRTDSVPPAAPPPEADPRSIGDLLSELTNETTALFKQEVALLKTEVRQEVKTVGVNLGALLAGGAVAYAGLLLLLMGAGFLLALFLPAWLAFVLVGALVAAVGYALVRKGLTTLQQESFMPDHTIESTKEDQLWLKNKAATP